MIGYIYKTTNLINYKIYVGQHKSLEFDKSYYGSGKLLLEAIDKYGIENFKCEIIEWCETEQEMNEKEIYYIALFHSKVTEGNYNISDGGFVPRLSGELNGNFGKHRHHTEEEKLHQSEVLKGHAPTFTGHHTIETKLAMAEGSKYYNLNFKDYNQVSEHHTGSKMLTNGIEQHWFYGDDIDKMKLLGWYEGICKPRAKKKQTEKSKAAYKKNGNKLKNTVWVHLKDVKKQIKLDELEYYISLGYTKGMKDKN